MTKVYVSKEILEEGSGEGYFHLYSTRAQVFNAESLSRLWSEIKEVEAEYREAEEELEETGTGHDFHQDIFSLVHDLFFHDIKSMAGNLKRIDQISEHGKYHNDAWDLANEILNTIYTARDDLLRHLLTSAFTLEESNKATLKNTFTKLHAAFNAIDSARFMVTDPRYVYFLNKVERKALREGWDQTQEYLDEVGLGEYFSDYKGMQKERADVLIELVNMHDEFERFKAIIKHHLDNIDSLAHGPCYHKLESISHVTAQAYELKAKNIRKIKNIQTLSPKDINNLLAIHDAISYSTVDQTGAPATIHLIDRPEELLKKVKESENTAATRERN